MALVPFFVPVPAKGVAEMVRVVRPRDVVAAYLWDIDAGGSPIEPIHAEKRDRTTAAAKRGGLPHGHVG